MFVTRSLLARRDSFIQYLAYVRKIDVNTLSEDEEELVVYLHSNNLVSLVNQIDNDGFKTTFVVPKSQHICYNKRQINPLVWHLAQQKMDPEFIAAFRKNFNVPSTLEELEEAPLEEELQDWL